MTVAEKPKWMIRGWHYHTEHPLELTEVLQGMDSSDGTSWEDMLGEVVQYFEWLTAQRQNRLEWILLWTEKYNQSAYSPLRQSRLQQLVLMAHQFGLHCGADAPIAEKQQHAWYMTTARETLKEQTINIQQHIDWMLTGAGFDYLSTESGFSEFTHPNCTLMLQWMNIATDFVTQILKKKIYIKCHCSSGQVCPDYTNPVTQEPLNFNFLPAYASPLLGIYAHTVQIYNWTNPAPTYGNTNFTFMLEFLFYEANSSSREVIYHGETAYWVNYDIDVPLFLPVYGASRLQDLRTIGFLEKRFHTSIQGQVNFESGWEWGYWISNSVTARASWNPLLSDDDSTALRSLLSPIASALSSRDPTFTKDIIDLIEETVLQEQQLLIYGHYNSSQPISDEVSKKNGMAYLAGWDSFTTFSAIFTPKDCTQPLRLTFQEMRDSFYRDGPNYQQEVQPLLAAMNQTFGSLASRWVGLYNKMLMASSDPLSSSSSPRFVLLSDIVDSALMTSHRIQEIFALYQYVWGSTPHLQPSHKALNSTWLQQQIDTADSAIYAALKVVQRRFQNYPNATKRVSIWSPNNPTSYRYGYLWTAQSLYYYWRDYSTATSPSFETNFPCFMNIENPIDIGFGTGPLLSLSQYLQQFLESKGYDNIAECLSAPSSAPIYPLTPFPFVVPTS